MGNVGGKIKLRAAFVKQKPKNTQILRFCVYFPMTNFFRFAAMN